MIDIKSKKYVQRMIIDLNIRLRNGESIYFLHGHYGLKAASVESDELKIRVNDSNSDDYLVEPDGFYDGFARQICVSREN